MDIASASLNVMSRRIINDMLNLIDKKPSVLRILKHTHLLQALKGTSFDINKQQSSRKVGCRFRG